MAISKSESVKKVKLNLKGLSQERKQRAKEEAGRVIIEGIEDFLDEGKSPVKKGKYKNKKADGTISDLFEDGDLRAQLKFRSEDDDSIVVGILSSAPEIDKLKSFNHNTGDTLPQRRFIPSPNQRFNDKIMKRVDRVIKSIREETPQTIAQDLGVEDLVDSALIEEILGNI